MGGMYFPWLSLYKTVEWTFFKNSSIILEKAAFSDWRAQLALSFLYVCWEGGAGNRRVLSHIDSSSRRRQEIATRMLSLLHQSGLTQAWRGRKRTELKESTRFRTSCRRKITITERSSATLKGSKLDFKEREKWSTRWSSDRGDDVCVHWNWSSAPNLWRTCHRAAEHNPWSHSKEQRAALSEYWCYIICPWPSSVSSTGVGHGEQERKKEKSG